MFNPPGELICMGEDWFFTKFILFGNDTDNEGDDGNIDNVEL